MTENKTPYKNAPITEAVIDIRVEPAPNLSVEFLKNEAVKTEYPTVSPIHRNFGQIQLGPNPSATATSEHTGYVHKALDGKQVFQFQQNGFVFSRLAPYQSWEPFCAEAKRLWEMYKQITSPAAITRIAVRYINRIDVPLPLSDFKDYLRTSPEVSADLPQGLSGYLMQLEIPSEDIEGIIAITQTIIPPPKPDVVSILLDIDISVPKQGVVDDAMLWNTLQALRVKKNAVFEACITPKTRELFD